ncbi:hypothetical protein MAJHIDBO_01271 [Propionibacterium freudenreichii subsp. shermanii]|nr:hypothetical protein MAJHIDBO_01271 [Propionibacterium freudenreichii subsp. shermanii]SPS09066.1 hypothetical protein MAJHIDBO_01271 [Propionibacterium freudenreichii subsp. shermanii]
MARASCSVRGEFPATMAARSASTNPGARRGVAWSGPPDHKVSSPRSRVSVPGAPWTATPRLPLPSRKASAGDAAGRATSMR